MLVIALPTIVLLSLEWEPWFDTAYSHLLSALRKRGPITEIRTERDALAQLRPSLAAVLVTDAAVADRKYTKTLDALVQYARAGGTVVYCCMFSSFVRPSDLNTMFRKWDLPWTSGPYHRSEFVISTGRVPVLDTSQLNRLWNVKALQVAGVTRMTAVYIEDGSTGTSPAAFAQVGSGYVGYIGDVNGEDETTAIILAMCGLDGRGKGERSSLASRSGPQVSTSTESAANIRQIYTKNGRELCLLCVQRPKAKKGSRDLDFCSDACKEAAMSSAPVIFELPPVYKAFEGVSAQFKFKWEHSTAVPRIIKIYKIFCEPRLMNRFTRYRQKVQRQSANNNANQCRRFHGTKRMCRLGDDANNLQMCDRKACSLCQIIKSSFELASFGKTTNFGRFGRGIYTSATSSKANDYVSEAGGSRYRSMLLNNVILGRTKKLYEDDESLTAPPPGFDSVLGEPGGVLNYDESIVYNNDAIIPAFLIIYDP